MTVDLMDRRITRLLNEAAAEVLAMFRQYVELEDIKQAMYLWMLEHEDKVPNLAKGNGWFLKRRLKDAAIPLGRKEKAAKSGYHPGDQYHYSLPVLVRLLPDAFDPDALPPATGPAERSPSGEATYQEWETQIADIRSGLRRISYQDREALEAFALGQREPGQAEVQTGLRALQTRLGGPR